MAMELRSFIIYIILILIVYLLDAGDINFNLLMCITSISLDNINGYIVNCLLENLQVLFVFSFEELILVKIHSTSNSFELWWIVVSLTIILHLLI